MQILTPTGYRDLADCAIGDEVVAFDVVTGAPIINKIEGWDTITPSYFATTLESKRAWVQSYEPISTEGRAYNKPWAMGGRWFKVGGMGRLYEWAMLDPQTVTPPMYEHVVNGKYVLFDLQGVWANGNVCHARDLKIGDTLYDEDDKPFQIERMESRECTEWIRMHISGDSSYISDGLTLHNADRYWVGGSGNTSDNTNHWSASNGGAPGASAPTSVDHAHWTAASNTTAYAVTVDATFNCADCLFEAAPSVSGTITLTGSAALNFYGSLLLLSGMTYTKSGSLTACSTATGKTITFNSVAPTVNTPSLVFNGVGGGWTLQDNILASSYIQRFLFQILAGAVDLNGKTCAFWNVTVNGTVTRSLTMGSAAVSLTSTGGSAIWAVSGSGYTISAASSTINIGDVPINLFASGVMLGAGQTYGTVNVAYGGVAGTAGAGIQDANTFANLSIVGKVGKNIVLAIAANQTVTGTLTITGNSAIDRLLIQSDTLGTTRTINAANVNHGNVDYMDITGTGAGWSAPTETGTIGNCLGNSGITFTAAADQYWYSPNASTGQTFTWSTVGNWFLGSGGTGGAGRVPLPQDNAIFNSSSIRAASTTVSADMPRLGKDITWAGVANSPAWTNAVTTYSYGSFTLSSGMTYAFPSPHSLFGRASHTIDTAGVTLSQGGEFDITPFGGTYTLSSAFTIGAAQNLFIEAGTFNTNGYSISCGTLLIGLSRAATINLGSATHFLGSSGAGPLRCFSTGTIIPGTSTIKLTDATASVKTFAGNGKIYNNIWLSGAGSGSFNFTGSNTFNEFKVDNLPKDIRFTAGTTTTLSTFTAPAYNAADTTFVRIGANAADYFSSPTKPVTGNQAITLDLSLQDFTPAADVTLLDKTSGNNGFAVKWLTTGKVRLVVGDGASLTNVDVVAACGFTDATRHTVTITWANGVGATFAYDGVTSGSQVAAAKTLTDSGTAISIGGATVASDIYRVQVGAVYDLNPANWASGNSWVSQITGETWTRNGNALIYPEIKISSITAAQHTLAMPLGNPPVSLRRANISYSNAT